VREGHIILERVLWREFFLSPVSLFRLWYCVYAAWTFTVSIYFLGFSNNNNANASIFLALLVMSSSFSYPLFLCCFNCSDHRLNNSYNLSIISTERKVFTSVFLCWQTNRKSFRKEREIYSKESNSRCSCRFINKTTAKFMCDQRLGIRFLLPQCKIIIHDFCCWYHCVKWVSQRIENNDRSNK